MTTLLKLRARLAVCALAALLALSGCGEPDYSTPRPDPPSDAGYGIVIKEPRVSSGGSVATTQSSITVMGIGPFLDWSGPFTGGCIQSIPTPADFTWLNVTTGQGGVAYAYPTNEWLAGCYFGDAVWDAQVPVAAGTNRIEIEASRHGSRIGWDWFIVERTAP